jgi:phosphopantetheinyl transferase
LELAKRFYHQLEFEQLKLISIFEGPTQFLRLWMMKEAYSKLQRLHLVEFINQAVSDKAVFEPLMKTRIGYQAIVARENY